MKYLILALALLSTPTYATPNSGSNGPNISPITGLLICTCGDPVTLIVNEKGNIKIIPASLFNEKTMQVLGKWCKGKAPIPVWKSENITNKACPISI